MNDNPQDQDLLKLIKQSKRKKRLLNIFSPLIVTFLFLLITGTLFLNYFNLGPFTGDKIAGVPDNHLRLVSNDSVFNKLIFNSSTAYQYNYYGNRVELWLEHYQNGKKIDEIQIGPISSPGSPSENHEIVGSLALGLNNQLLDRESQTLSYYLEFNGASGSQVLDLKDYGIAGNSGIAYSHGIPELPNLQSFYSKNSYKIQKDTPYDLLILRDDGKGYMSTKREEQFKDVPNGIAIYLIFK